MSVRSSVLVVFVVALSLVACRSSTLTGEFAGRPTDTTYYTRYSLMYENGKHATTNYRVGVLLPANSKVTFVAGNNRRLKLRRENGTEVLIDNVPKHTGESMEQAFDKLLSPTMLDFSHFTADEREAIALGQVRKGMSRDAVLVAMGYPPVTGTPTLDSHTWKYWRTKWATFLVVFDDQWRVSECPE